MWLINTKTLELKSTANAKDYKYAILSHTWGDDEVTFEDMKDPVRARKKTGFQKIWKTCERASQQGLDWAWVDTCCIDKSSSAELSESINSMFQWYYLSAACYTWLEDWDGLTPESMRGCRWFTRGWTLQELIAPRSMEFLDHRWTCRGNKSTLGNIISSVTRVDLNVLHRKGSLESIPVARRMSWAATRQTTRVEDRAYSLLGIFNINMPLLYGEGHKAFLRLQEEIAKNSSDLSLFAWEMPPRLNRLEFLGIFASKPDYFKDCDTLVSQANQFYNLSDFVITNKGLNIRTSLIWCCVSGIEALGLSLWCHKKEFPDSTIAVPLLMTASGYARSHYGTLGFLQSPFQSLCSLSTTLEDKSFFVKEPRHILVRKEIVGVDPLIIRLQKNYFLSFKVDERCPGFPKEFSLTGYPPALWDAKRIGFHLGRCTEFVGIVIISEQNLAPASEYELQVVCGYCLEAGGCWASIVPKPKPHTEPLTETSVREAQCASLLSMVRNFKDEACLNSWYGYHFLRNLVFINSKGGSAPTKTNMRVDGMFEMSLNERGSIDIHRELRLNAHLKCTDDLDIGGPRGGPNGTVTVIVDDEILRT